ncbi:unnamed protein product [Adineta steineri]|uniref:PLAT domain-containing protein n=2 Tax=Adineta steineri TaxID=433720 RepID=A0A818TAD6_9BILA|nr:unnamed protein product [Adineta steineri]
MVLIDNLSIWIILMIIAQILVTTSSAITVAPQCSSYTLINDTTRSVNVTTSGNCDDSFFGSHAKWFRFVGVGGTQIPTSPVPIYRCNADAPGWYAGQMPTNPNTTTNGTVCFNWDSDNCNWNISISVTNCGSYYVYQLSTPPTCNLRYCTEMPAVLTADTTKAPIQATTTMAPTTTRIQTTIAPTTTRPIQTSVALTTTREIQTSVAPTTTRPIQTSVALTTTAIQTSVAPTTTRIQTTVIPATTAIQTTMAAITAKTQTTVVPITTVIQTSVASTTTTRIQTTVVPITTALQTTMPPTTTRVQTTVVATTTEIQTTEASTTTEIRKEQITSMATSTVSTINSTCLLPTVTLIPGALSLSSPLQFRRSQDFYISSTVQFNCNISLSMTTQWTIKNCSLSCSYKIPLDPKIITTLSELYIPSRTLAYGLYQLELTVTMINLPSLPTLSSSVYVRITPSGITANLVQLGTSMITRGDQQDLKLDPGTYSVNPDSDSFDATKWKYEYYCRIYGLYMFPNFQGSLLSIDDPRIDPSNPSCLSNQIGNKTALKFDGVSLLSKSSVTILAGSLKSNRTYQFMVQMENIQNSSIQATGYVLVKVDDTHPQMIVIGCVISTMCVPNLEFQFVNPTTQVALFAICNGNCTTLESIIWNIYQGSSNSSSNVTQWILFNQTNSYENIWFFGRNTSNFTATNQLFLNNPQIDLWRFEVVYNFTFETSVSSLNFIINQPPYNGSCSMNPLNGTTSTLFTIECPNWFDEDEIKDYSLYIWTTDQTERMMIAFSPVPVFQVHLPAGLLHMMIDIRDSLDCIAQFNMSSVSVTTDFNTINDLINNIQNSTTNPFMRILASGNQNLVGQVIVSVSQQFNKMNNESIDNAVLSKYLELLYYIGDLFFSDGIPATSISISSLESQYSQGNFTSLNDSALIAYKKELNSLANVRDQLIKYMVDLQVFDSNSLKLQSLSLAQLSESTNQLTRTVLMLVSNKCHQLSLALRSMATQISYEDVQIVTTQLIQCATNILSAVNGPLQERTLVLDLDSSRATNFPDDYDTDIESEWSNPNLFADGNDFSWKTIEKGRNTYYQQQLANTISNQTNEIISLLTSTLNIHINIGQNFTINTPSTFMSLETISIETLSNKQIQQVGNGQINIPEHLNSSISNNSTVMLRSRMEPLAVYGSSKSQLANTNVSTSISLSVVDRNGNEVIIKTNKTHPIEIIIPHDLNLIIPSMIIQNVTSINSTFHNQSFSFHYINITNTLPISAHIEIHPLETNISYLFIYKFDQIPQLNTSINQIDGWTVFCPFNLTNESMYTYSIDNQQTFGHQSIIFGLRELNSTEFRDFCINSSIVNPPITDEKFNFTSNYELRIYTSGCYYLDENNQWKSDGLLVGPLTNHYETQCFSTHLTTFASGFRILPESVNWNYVFANADFMKNKTIYLIIICVCVIYIILILFSRYKDKKDIEKLGVTPLPDNHKADEYFYQIIVFTGQRKYAGTKSKVHFVLCGDSDTTPVRTFADPHRQIFQRGGIDAFIMAVPKSLGLLNCIRIWHDNSGKGSSSSWFLKYIIVRDLQTMEKFHFISRQWFAVEKGDGNIERILPIASEIEKQEFSYVLSKKSYHSISDGHLWFSIFSRPPSTKFTCVQRCTCCFVLLFISMFLNIMYYDLSNEEQTNSISLSFDSFYINPQQIIIGIIVEVFALIPSLLLVQLFRRLRSRRQQLSPLRQALYLMKSNLEIKNENKQKLRRTFPWWCIFIAYGLCILLVGLSIIFIIARGIEFGDDKTQKWLISILSGFFSSIFLTQPLKIISLAIFFAFFCRKPNDDKEANEYLNDDQFALDEDEEYLHSIKNKFLFIYRSPIRANRLNQDEIISARDRRLKEVYMWSILREIFIYICFLSLLCIITYSNRHSNAFLQVNHLRKYFLNSDYTKISTISQYWNWLENSFVENIHAQQWYNGDAPRNLSGFINDKSNRLIGWVTMRQLRIKSQSCQYDYSSSNEDKQSYQPGWSNETIETYSLFITESFQYQSSKDLDTYTYVGDHGSYPGSGYVYEFRGRLSDLQSNLSQLHTLGWIDNQTRAVIIELSLYNPNVQLFTSGIFLMEILSTGGMYPSARFEPMNFDAFTSTFQLISIFIYMIMILYFIWIEIRLLKKLKWNYFQRFWSCIEIGIIVCSWTSVVLYIWRYKECKRIGKLFKETNGYVYINLQLASYVNDILTYLFAFCCFFGTIKSFRLCRFNQRLNLFIDTLRYARKDLISFAMMFSMVFISFMCLFYLLFVSRLGACLSLLKTSQMLFEISLMKFNTHELSEAAPFLGPFCFSFYILLVVFICMSMFLTIINHSFRRARENINDNQEMFSYMLIKFQRWIGLKKVTKEERYTFRRLEYFDPIEHFPDKIDQLLDAINRLYMTQISERSTMEKDTL